MKLLTQADLCACCGGTTIEKVLPCGCAWCCICCGRGHDHGHEPEAGGTCQPSDAVARILDYERERLASQEPRP